MRNKFATKSRAPESAPLCKMNFLLILLLASLKLCDSSDYKCVHFNDTQKSVEFYCENYDGILPENCTSGNFRKSQVTHLRIGGCKREKINQIVNDCKYILWKSMDISRSDFHNPLLSDISACFSTEPDLLYNIAPQTLKYINLSHSNMFYLGRNDLPNRPNLQNIDLSHNDLKIICRDDIFSKATNLKVLRFEKNPYETFDKIFVELIKRDIVLHFSWEHVINFQIKENIGKPFRVMLNSGMEGVWPSPDGDRIEFHCSERSFNKIGNFEFTDNYIENPVDLLQCLTFTLQRLILVGNFNELSSYSLEPFTSMWELVISGAQSMEFDLDSIKRLKRLYTIQISYNHLKEIGNASLLEKLPVNFFNVAGNHIKNAPEVIQHFPASTLQLDGNYVGKLNVSTFQIVNLTNLHLRSTNLSFDNVKPFEVLKRLSTLDISYNILENADFSVPSTAFKNLSYFAAAHCRIPNASKLIELLGSPIR